MAVAFLFAGQGAQYPGMGKELYEQSVAAKAVMDRCEAIRPGTLQMCFSGEKEALNQTVHTQPCLFAVDLACGAALAEAGILAGAAAGFSLGEWAAAAFGGMMTVETAFSLVVKRAAYMEECAKRHPGAMAAVLRLEADQVEALCEEIGELYPVNYNCPGQIVVSGKEASIDTLTERVKPLRGRVMPLPVSGPFHTLYMGEAAEQMAGELGNISLHPPTIPLYANVNGQPYGKEMVGTLSSQIESPVRWQRTMEQLWEDGFDSFVELGPGKTLSGFLGRMAFPATICHVEDMMSIMETVERLGGR